MDDLFMFAGVMMTLLATGLLGYGGLVLISALQKRGERSRVSSGLNPDEVELFRAQVGETESLRARVGELEERLDFAERMLADRPENRQLDNPTRER